MTLIFSGWTVSLFELGSILFVQAPQGRAVDLRWEPAARSSEDAASPMPTPAPGASIFERREGSLWAGPLALYW